MTFCDSLPFNAQCPEAGQIIEPGQKWRTKFSHLPIIITVVESRNGEPYVEYIKGNMSGFYSHINYFLENNERLPE